MAIGTVEIVVDVSGQGDPIVQRAARELQSYLGRILKAQTVISQGGGKTDDVKTRITIALPSDKLYSVIVKTGAAALQNEEYIILSEQHSDSQQIWVIGENGASCLTGIYKLLSQFGCCFHFHGDILPPVSDTIAQIDIAERYMPRFALRGTQLWCYWYSGRDVWDFETYRSYLDQFPKLGINLFDFPLYFYEPLYTGYTVGDVRPSGYFLSGRNLDTLRFGQSEFAGAPTAFTSADIPRYCSDPDRSAAAINLMRRVFDYAKSLGIKSCVGIEVANQLDFSRDVANAMPIEDRYEDGRLIQPSSDSARTVLTARLQALFDAYPMCDYFGLWQSEAGVFRTTGGSPHPSDIELRKQLCGQYPSLKPSDADYVSWLLLADDIASQIKPEARFVTSGWGSEAVFACADAFLSERFICSSIAPYEPKLALESGGLDFYAHTSKEKWNVTWAETDQHMWVMQPKLAATSNVLDRLEKDSVSGIMVLHWNTLFCDINLGFYASQCWSPKPRPEDFRQSWAQQLYGDEAASAVVATFLALEQLNDLTVESDPTMQSWVGYECFINPLLQAYRFIDVTRPFPDSWMATYVAPHLTYGARFLAALDQAVVHAGEAVRLADTVKTAAATRLLHRVQYVRGLYACHIQLAEAMQLWNAAISGVGSADQAGMMAALDKVADCDVTGTLAYFTAGLDKDNGPANIGELGLLLSLNEKFMGGIARLRGRLERAIHDMPAPFHQASEGALLAIWPGMQIAEMSLLARDDPHAPSCAPAAGLPRQASMDLIEGTADWHVHVGNGVTSQRFSKELGFWRHLDAIHLVIEAPASYSDPVRARIYLAEDADWDSLFRRQTIIVNGDIIGEYDDFLSQGEDMSEGYWVEASCYFIDGKLTIDIARKGNSDVVVAGIVVI